MAPPWNKRRISRFIADLRSPAKHGGLFTVQTGFPASLVDLFVKNRDRRRKSAAKKHGIRSSAVCPAPPAIAPPPSSIKRRPSEVDLHGDEYRNNRCDGELSANRVVAVVLKCFVVVALALSTKNMAVGITFSAFLLFLLEFAVDADLLLKPFFNASQRPLSPEIKLPGDSFEEHGVDSGRINQSFGDEEEDRNNVSKISRIKNRIIEKLQALKTSKKKMRTKELESEKCKQQKIRFKTIESDEESEGRRRGGGSEVNSGCVMLILIVLVGLIDGKVWAFVLTLVWCIILQIVRKPCVYKMNGVDS